MKKKRHKRPPIPRHKELQQPKYRAKTEEDRKNKRRWLEDNYLEHFDWETN